MSSKLDFIELDQRAHDVFRHIVESFMNDGNPVGSRTLSRSVGFSPATIRNVMSDLEEMGLLQAPHVSAGRLPTDQGLRYFVDGILEKGALSDTDRAALEEECSNSDLSINGVLEQASSILSGLSASAGLVVAPTQDDKTIRHIEFVSLSPEKTMVILVSEDGAVENRVIDMEPGITIDMLRQAGNFLSEKLYGRTVRQMRDAIMQEIKERQSEMGKLMTTIIEAGLASKLDNGKLIVHGRSQLLRDTQALENLERLQDLMEQLESTETVSKLLEEATNADGVKIYIGSENSIFEGSGHSLILSPYRNGNNNIIGAIGVIGPTRLNYAKIIPSVNYMAELISRRIQSFL
jgi:heat-inducible transcriptional repressor